MPNELNVNLYTHFSISYQADKNLWYYLRLYEELTPNSPEIYFAARLAFFQITILKLHTLYSSSKNDKYSFINLINTCKNEYPQMHAKWKDLSEFLAILDGVQLKGLKLMRHKTIAHLDPDRHQVSNKDKVHNDTLISLSIHARTILTEVAKTIKHPTPVFKHEYQENNISDIVGGKSSM